jgi:uncharacterized protein YjbI with pentapeptide repeats
MGKDLSGANLSGMDLTGANFTDTKMVGANMTNTNLSQTNLTKADLTRADLRGAILDDTNLTRTNMDEVNLADTNLTKAQFARTKLNQAQLNKVDMSGVEFGGELMGADLSGAVLGRVDLSGIDLSEANMSGAILTNATLKYAKMDRVNLSGADLSGANLTLADLTNAILDGAVLDNVILDDATLDGTILVRPTPTLTSDIPTIPDIVDLESIEVDEAMQITQKCQDLIGMMEESSDEFIKAEHAFLMIVLGANNENDVLCYDLDSIDKFYKNYNDGWFYECTGNLILGTQDKAMSKFGETPYVKIPIGMDGQNAFIPANQVAKMMEKISTDGAKVFYVVPHLDVDGAQQLITHTVSYKNASYKTSDFVSSNHCQAGSSILVYDIKMCDGEKCS